ncbi:MAG TPA: hypothetical protein VFI96_09165, partial [Longimicrobiaceae bacterium]|nr:hypothetical protein [Longimicrobiaceae bacterium]
LRRGVAGVVFPLLARLAVVEALRRLLERAVPANHRAVRGLRRDDEDEPEEDEYRTAGASAVPNPGPQRGRMTIAELNERFYRQCAEWGIVPPLGPDWRPADERADEAA